MTTIRVYESSLVRYTLRARHRRRHGRPRGHRRYWTFRELAVVQPEGATPGMVVIERTFRIPR